MGGHVMDDAASQTGQSHHHKSQKSHRPVGGPVPRPWREGTLTRARELEALWTWVVCKDPPKHYEDLVDGILQHLQAARQAAEGRQLHPRRRFKRFWLFRKGSQLERATSNLDAAEALLLNIASPGYVLGQMPSLLNDVRRHLIPTDPRRQELERIGQRLGVKDADHPLVNQPGGHTLQGLQLERIVQQPDVQGRDRMLRNLLQEQVLGEGIEKYRRERIIQEERGKIVTALRGARSAALREQLRVRSFSMALGATIVALTVIAVGVAIMGARNPTAVPLCFAPEESGQPTEVVCPTAVSEPIPQGTVTGQELDRAIQQAVRSYDLLLIELLGLTAAAVAAAVAIRNIRGSSEALHLPVLLAVLKLPTGAITAFLGLLLMRGQFVPGLSALDTSAQILAWALVFGYAQQLFTRFVDQQGQTVLESVRGADKVNQPIPSPP
jgi:hypothetical protein